MINLNLSRLFFVGSSTFFFMLIVNYEADEGNLVLIYANNVLSFLLWGLRKNNDFVLWF